MKAIASYIARALGCPSQRSSGIFKWDTTQPLSDIIRARQMLVRGGFKISPLKLSCFGVPAWSFEVCGVHVTSYQSDNKGRICVLSPGFEGSF